jgi:hypothetical protein
MQTAPSTKTLVLAKSPAPIKHTPKLSRLRIEQYRKRHQRPLGIPALSSPTKYPMKKLMSQYVLVETVIAFCTSSTKVINDAFNATGNIESTTDNISQEE